MAHHAPPPRERCPSPVPGPDRGGHTAAAGRCTAFVSPGPGLRTPAPTSATSPRAHPANVLRAGGQRFLTALFTPAQWKRLFLLVEGTGGGMLVFTGL